MYPTVTFTDHSFPPDWFEAESARIAGGLRNLGVGPGCLVAAVMRNSPHYLSLLLATKRLGAYFVPVNWHFKASEVRYILDDSKAVAVFVDEDVLPQVRAGIPDGTACVVVGGPSASAGLGTLAYDSLCGDFDDLSIRHGISQHLVPYTSGTTGRPKGVKRHAVPSSEREAQERDLLQVAQTFFGALRPDSVAMLCAPMYHSAPLSFSMHVCRSAAHLVLEPTFDAERTLALIDHHKVTHVYLVPTMFQRLLRLPAQVRERYSLGSVQQVVSTGSPCAASLKRAMIDWWGPVITESYASSEAGSITFIDSATWLQHPGSVGKPVGRARLAILDDDRHPVAPGNIGLVYARQPSQPDFTYIGNEQARVAIEHEGMITLGDMGYLDEEGFLYICDRKSDMVISGGVNIYPAEVEAVLQTMPGISDCAIFGIPDEEFGESLAAAIQLQPHATTSPNQVREYLQARIANYKVPRHIDFHDSLPREETGKIFKRLLREPYWARHARTI